MKELIRLIKKGLETTLIGSIVAEIFNSKDTSKLLSQHFLTIFMLYLNPNQAGVFWNHIGWRGTLHDCTLGQNLSKAIKILLTSSLGGRYDVIKPFFVSVPGQNSSSLIFCPMDLKFGTGVNSEVLFSNSSKKSDINTFWRR